MRTLGLLRIRNESLILEDTLDHLAQFTDGIIVFDDASHDDTIQIARKHSTVLEIIENKLWRLNRLEEETRHRQLLLEAAQKYNPLWIFYSDCDERFCGSIREFLYSEEAIAVDGVRVSLFDAYMTPEDCEKFAPGRKLLNFRKYFGPERRDILMLWKNKPTVRFRGLDAREPSVHGDIITRFYCQHYGKSLSTEHWEQTCEYYATYFPEPYKTKWRNRKGGAIHTKSDFGTPLYEWGEVIKNAVIIHPISIAK